MAEIKLVKFRYNGGVVSITTTDGFTTKTMETATNDKVRGLILSLGRLASEEAEKNGWTVTTATRTKGKG